MAEHDPTAAEVAAAIATLQAFEHAREVATESPAQAEPHAAASVAEAASAPVHPTAVDPYLARSVKSSPNGF